MFCFITSAFGILFLDGFFYARTKINGGPISLTDHFSEFFFGQGFDSQFFGFVEFGAGGKFGQAFKKPS